MWINEELMNGEKSGGPGETPFQWPSERLSPLKRVRGFLDESYTRLYLTLLRKLLLDLGLELGLGFRVWVWGFARDKTKHIGFWESWWGKPMSSTG